MAHTLLACQSDATKPETTGFHHINVSVILRFGGLWVCDLSLLMKYWLPLDLQLQTQYPNFHFLSYTGYVSNIIFLWIYSITILIQKTIRMGNSISEALLRCVIFSYWRATVLQNQDLNSIFWLTQMICSGNVSTSWCWCQVLFMLSCPPGTRKSILHPPAVRGEEKHWPLILSWSTLFSAPWFISWPGLKWACNTNVYLVYPLCLCHQLLFISPDIL